MLLVMSINYKYKIHTLSQKITKFCYIENIPLYSPIVSKVLKLC